MSELDPIRVYFQARQRLWATIDDRKRKLALFAKLKERAERQLKNAISELRINEEWRN